MKVCVEPVGLFSPAMVRIARALERYAPDPIEIVSREDQADLIVLYVIGADYIDCAKTIKSSGRDFAVVQCCLHTAGYGPDTMSIWNAFWRRARLVWSYYNLSVMSHAFDFDFYHAPLGLDDDFIRTSQDETKGDYVLTTGCVSGPNAEAIDEVWQAAKQCGLRSIHVGPERIEGTVYRPNQSMSNIPDLALRRLYRHAQWVCSLRHVEGFELPALEGLGCGTRPILFDQPDLRHWYGDHAVYVPECSGEELISRLVDVFKSVLMPVSEHERCEIIRAFDWRATCEGFWSRMLK